jgi:hypothetical protein
MSKLSHNVRCFGALLLLAASAHAQKLAWTVATDGDDTTADRLYRLNVETAETILVGKLPDQNGDVEGLALDNAGVLFGVDDIEKSLLRISTSNASAQSAGSLRLPTGLANNLDLSIAIDCSGQAFMASAVNNRVYRLNLSNGQPEQVSSNGTLPGGVTDIVFRDDTLFGLGEDRLYRIDKISGAATQVSASYGSGIRFTDGGGLSVDSAGQLWAVADRGPSRPSQIYRIDAESGAATLSGQSPIGGLESLSLGPPLCRGAAPVAAIPVPLFSHFGLLLVGALVLVAGLFSLSRSR